MDRTPPDATPKPLTFVLAAVWTLLVALTVNVILSLIDVLHPGAVVDVVTVATCKLLAYSVVLFAILRLHEPDSSIRDVLIARRPPVLVVILAAVVGAGLAPAAMWLDDALAVRFPPSQMELDAYARIFDTPTPGKKVALLLALVVVMPVCDELFFRGALFTPLRRGHRTQSVILATAAYDTLLGGAQPREIASILATALALAWIRAVSGSVVPSVVARVAFFAVQVVPIVMFARELSLSPLIAGAGVIAALLGVVGIATMAGRSSRIVDARLEDD